MVGAPRPFRCLGTNLPPLSDPVGVLFRSWWLVWLFEGEYVLYLSFARGASYRHFIPTPPTCASAIAMLRLQPHGILIFQLITAQL